MPALKQPRTFADLDTFLTGPQLERWDKPALERAARLVGLPERQSNPRGLTAGGWKIPDLPTPKPLYASGTIVGSGPGRIRGTPPRKKNASVGTAPSGRIPGVSTDTGAGRKSLPSLYDASLTAWGGRPIREENRMGYRTGAWLRRGFNRLTQPGALVTDGQGLIGGTLLGSAMGVPVGAGLQWLRNLLTGEETSLWRGSILGGLAGGAAGGFRGTGPR